MNALLEIPALIYLLLIQLACGIVFASQFAPGESSFLRVNHAKDGYSLIMRNNFRLKYLLADKAYDTDKIWVICAS